MSTSRVNYIWLFVDGELPTRDNGGEKDYVVTGMTRQKFLKYAEVLGGTFTFKFTCPDDSLLNGLDYVWQATSFIKTNRCGSNTPSDGDEEVGGHDRWYGDASNYGWNYAETALPGQDLEDAETPTGPVEFDWNHNGHLPVQPMSIIPVALLPGESFAIRVTYGYDNADVNFDAEAMNHHVQVDWNGLVGL